jgi:DNA-binding transcriptional ArsR family regulator
MTTTSETVLRLDPGGLKVLAHPLRSRLLAALRMDGPATATMLATTIGTNTGATSYHLRKLASVGLVEETGQGRGRERWWRASTQMHGWTERSIAGDPDAEAATDWLRRHYLTFFLEGYQAWLDIQGSWPLEWRDAAGPNDYVLRLTPDRLADLQAGVQALLERFHDDGDPDPEAELVQIYVYAFPFVRNRT